MKKTYSKPALYAESFELAEHIALCSGFKQGVTQITHWSNDTTCSFTTENSINLFYTGANVCVNQYDTASDVEVSCYNNPTNGIGQPFGS